VKEQSHKDEMSKALRGDFERLRDRGVATTLAPPDEEHARITPDEPEPVVELEAELTQPEREPEPGPEPVTQAAAEVPVAEAEGPSPGWLGRLLGR
jgi:hypothetical protein